MSPAPIVVFAYKRPALLAATLRALAANDLAGRSPLIVRCDGPKPGARPEELEAIAQVRDAARAAQGFARVEVIEAPVNKGLARSVIEGVTEAVQAHGRVIVVEEDVELSPFFLRFMNAALDRYAGDERVLSIGAWNYFAPGLQGADAFFLRYPDSIAWATWKRAWDLFEPDGRALMKELIATGRLKALEAGGHVRYFEPMLSALNEGRIDSWAIRWTALSVLRGKLNLFPRAPLAKHAGFGADATHEQGSDDYNAGLRLARAPMEALPAAIEESPAALERWAAFVRERFMPADASLKARLYRRLPQPLRARWRRLKTLGTPSPQRLAFPPVSRAFGFDRGTPIDRRFIDRFLGMHRPLIRGAVMEIEEDRYASRFGDKPSVTVLRYQGSPGTGIRIGDLTRHDTLPQDGADCFICTQTLNFIYDVRAAIGGLHRALRPGGTALVTVAAISPISRYDADRWGDYWRFTPQGIQRLFAEVFGEANVEVASYGNSYAAACLLKGFAAEECDAALLDEPDPDYPVLIGIKARRA